MPESHPHPLFFTTEDTKGEKLPREGTKVKNETVRPFHKFVFCKLWQKYQDHFPKTWKGGNKEGDYGKPGRVDSEDHRTNTGPSLGARRAMKAFQCLVTLTSAQKERQWGDWRVDSKYPSNTG